MGQRGKRYKEEQIIYVLRQVDGGRKIAEVCRELGVSEQTYHRWKKQYAGMGISELRKLKKLEDENSSLRRLVADLSLNKHILQEIVSIPSKATLASLSAAEQSSKACPEDAAGPRGNG